MAALIYCAKGYRRDNKWFHPRTGEFISEADREPFVMYAVHSETGEIIVSFIVDRTCLEQVQENIDKALTVDPVVIRECP